MESSHIINAIIIFILSMSVTSICVPLVIKLAIKRRLFDEGGGRHIHKGFVPRLGGVAIFAGFVFSQLYFSVDHFSASSISDTYLLLIFSISLLFILGLMDDLVNINPMKKAYIFENKNGVDLKTELDKLPSFWSNRISELDINKNIDQISLQQAIKRNDQVVIKPWKLLNKKMTIASIMFFIRYLILWVWVRSYLVKVTHVYNERRDYIKFIYSLLRVLKKLKRNN